MCFPSLFSFSRQSKGKELRKEIPLSWFYDLETLKAEWSEKGKRWKIPNILFFPWSKAFYLFVLLEQKH